MSTRVYHDALEQGANPPLPDAPQQFWKEVGLAAPPRSQAMFGVDMEALSGQHQEVVRRVVKVAVEVMLHFAGPERAAQAGRSKLTVVEY